MGKYGAALVLGLYCATLQAGGSIGPNLGSGPDDYLSAGGGLSWWSDDGSLIFDSRYLRSRSSYAGEYLYTSYASGDLTYAPDDVFSVYGGFVRQREVDVDIGGRRLGMSLGLNGLWGGSRYTSLTLERSWNDYRGPNARGEITRSGTELALSRDFTDAWSGYVSATQYSYDRDVRALAQFFRRRNNFSALSVLAGFLDQSFNGGVSWLGTGDLSASLDITRTKSVRGEWTNLITLTPSIFIGQSTVLDFSVTRISSDDDASLWMDLGMRYYW